MFIRFPLKISWVKGTQISINYLKKKKNLT